MMPNLQRQMWRCMVIRYFSLPAPVKHRHWKPPIISHVQMPYIGTSNNDQLMQLIGEV